MDDHLLRLLSVASEPILTPPHSRELESLSFLGEQITGLEEMLALKNGWYAFESSLHGFPLGAKSGVMDLRTWNSNDLWRNHYKYLDDGCFFFAEDVFGVQFCFLREKIHTFDPETGTTQNFANNLGEWSKKILDDFNLHTGYPLAHEWQSEHGPLKPGERLLPKIPFVLQGSYTIENLYSMDAVEGMKFRASIATQIQQLPDGSKVRLKIVR